MRLKELRKERHLTQAALAEKVGLVESSICLYESGKREPDLTTLARIADCLNVSVDYLIGRTNEQQELIVAAPADEYSDEEKRLVGAYRVLPEGKRLFLLEMIEKFAAEERGSGHGNKWNRG